MEMDDGEIGALKTSSESMRSTYKRNTFKLPKIVRRSSTISKVSRYSERRSQDDITEEMRFEIDIDQWVIREEVVKPTNMTSSEDGNSEDRKDLVDVGVETSRILQVIEAGLKMDFGDKVFPDITELSSKDAFETMTAILGVTDANMNLCSFWIVDTLADILRRCQNQSTLPENQKVILTWVLFVLKSIAISPEPREKMFDDIIRMLIEIDLSTNPGNTLPSPQLILEKVRERKWEKKLEKFERLSLYMDFNDLDSLRSMSLTSSEDSVSVLLESIILAVSENTTLSNQSGRLQMYDLTLLINIIYELFANRFMYDVIRETFSNPPEIIPITILEDIPIPKPVQEADPGVSPKSSVGTEKAKKRTSKKSRVGQGSMKTRFLTMLSTEIKNEEKQAKKDTHILALRDAVDNKFMGTLLPKKGGQGNEGQGNGGQGNLEIKVTNSKISKTSRTSKFH